MGKATHVEKRGKGQAYSWAVVEGDTCTSMFVMKVPDEDDFMVGAVGHPRKEKKGEALYEECVKLLGKK